MKNKMKTLKEIDAEIDRCMEIMDKLIKKQSKGIELTEVERLIKKESNARFFALLWVTGEFD